MNIGEIIAGIINRLSKMTQVKPDFNDSIVEYPVGLPRNRLIAFARSIFPYQTVIKTNERIVENPFVFMNLNLSRGSRILEVGCCRSTIAIQLASLGYKVTACDLKYYKYKHPNLFFIQGDLRKLSLPIYHFDAATIVSTIEHTGMGAYGELIDKNGDKQMIQKIRKLLKPKGQIILTVPFGKKERSNSERIYDNKSLKKLLKGFKITNIEFYQGYNRDYWIPSTLIKLSKISSISKGFVQGVACITAIKL